MKKLLTFAFVAAMLAGCTDPINKKVAKETVAKDLKEIKEKHATEYTDADFEKLGTVAGFQILGNAMGVNKNEVPTYKTLLDTLKGQRLKLAAELAAYEVALKKMQSLLTIGISEGQTKKGPYNIGDYYVMQYNIVNNDAKPIAAYEGVIRVESLTGTKLASFTIESSNTMLPGQKISNGGVWPIFDNVYQLETTPFNKLKFNWEPRTIVYENGEKVLTPVKPAEN